MTQSDPYGLAAYGARFEGAKLHKKEEMLEVALTASRLIDAPEAEAIAAAFCGAVPGCVVALRVRMKDCESPLLGRRAFFEMLSRSWAHFSPLMRVSLKNAEWDLRENRVEVRISEKLYHAAKNYNGAHKLMEFVKNTYGVDLEIDLSPDSSVEAPRAAAAEETEGDDWADAPFDMPAAQKQSPQKKKNVPRAAKTRVSQKDVIMGTPVSTKPVSMAAVNEESGTVTVRGEIISLDARPRKNGGFILVLYLTDRSNTLPVKLFPTEQEKYLIARLEEVRDAGDWVVVHGRYSRDEFSGMYCVFADSIYRTDAEHREDKAERKRVELHLHTKMSAMDGFIDAEKAVETAARWGHRAIAITDHGVVQAFPAAVSAAKKLAKKGKDVKVLMGVEGYLLPDCALVPMEGSFCAIEAVTSPGVRSENVFALCALRQDERGDERLFSTLVNAGAPLPEGYAELYGIDPRALEDAPTSQEALAALGDFIGDARIVTHDARTLLKLFRKAEALNIDFPRECVAVDRLAHELCREKPVVAPETPQECLDAMGIQTASGTPEDLTQALMALFETCVTRMEKLGLSRLPVWDCVPQEKVKGKRSTFHIILIAQNPVGLKHLYKLVSYAHLEHLRGVPQIPRSLLLFHREGIIVGSACEAGEVFRAVLEGEPSEKLASIAREYDYLEVQPTGNNEFLVRGEIVKDTEGLRDLNRRIVALGDELGIPVVATGDAHFLDPEDAIFRAIVMSAREFKDAEQQAPLFFHTTDDMLEEFSYLGEEKALEIVVENPNRIADSCEKMMPFLSEKGTYAPEFPNAGEELKNTALKRAHEIYGEELPPVVEARLKKELDSIIGNGYASLYLSAERLVKKSNSDGYLVGSRGSVGSSFVATMAGITEVNPLQPHYVCPNCRHSDFDADLTRYTCGIDMPDANCPVCGAKYQKLGYTIPFEAFLGFKGDKTPDIDLNFSGEYQPVAHKYVEVMFGEGYAFRAGTIAGLKDKTVYGYIKGYCEQRETAFSRAETERLVHGCEGVKRTTGQHPGGIIIVPEGYEIFDFTPIQYPADKSDKNTITTHFDFHAMDDRLVKLDILGHDDPTAMRMFHEITGIDPKDIPQDDPETMRIFSSVEPLGTTLEALECDVGSIAIPEFGTPFVRKMLMDTRPTSMDELVRISGLSHGTDVWLGNAQDMVLGGIATLSQVICTREDIMNTLMAMGGEASISFKTMESVRKGKGLTEEMEQNLAKLNAPEWFVNSLRKIKYLFPRAHAAAYVMMSFRTAYYKVHRPLAFYSVYFSARADAFDVEAASGGEERVLKNIKAIKDKGNRAEQKEQDLLTILEVVYEMNRRGIELLPVDLYKSDATRFLIEGNALRPPFSAIAGVGAAAAEGIGAAKAEGIFASVEDFRARAKANSAVVEKLRALGCFKGMPEANQITLFSL
jgi:DNA polymerase-3 subunit alpha (Gram-positive type)